MVEIFLWKKKGEPRVYMSSVSPANRDKLREDGFKFYKAMVPLVDEPAESPTHDAVVVGEAKEIE